MVIMDINIGRAPGPIDDSVLYEQHGHVSQRIWENDFDFKPQIRNGMHCKDNLNIQVLQHFYNAGFYGLYQLYTLQVDWHLIGALVERWRPETHTFHFPPGELTVTLQDIEVLAGVCVDGPPVIYNNRDETEEIKQGHVHRLLGVRPPISAIKSGGLKFTWLKENFDNLPSGASPLQIEQYSRAMMLLLLAGTYLSDKSNSHVTLQFLPFFENVQNCRQLSWGSAILSCLYSNLCKASLVNLNRITRNSIQIVGPLIILQIWAWTRLTQICPIRKLQDLPQGNNAELTYGYRVASASRTYSSETVAHNQRWFRDQFDSMKDEQVIWEPYIGVLNDLPYFCTAGNEVWLTRSPLLYFNNVEYHYPDRVKRQFGMRQNVPESPIDIGDIHWRKNDPSNWLTRHMRFVTQWNNRYNFVVQGVMHDGFMPVTNDYISWFKNITRLRIGKPEVHPPRRGFQAMSGYKEKSVRMNYCV